MQNFDIAAKYAMDVMLYSVVLNDNTQATIPTGVVTLKKPFAVFMVDAVIPPTAAGLPNVVEAFAWEVDSDNKPLVTAQFTNNVGSVYCTVAVCYKA